MVTNSRMGSVRVARIAGIDLRVHFTFLFLLAYQAAMWSESGLSGALFGAVLTIAIFACIALHELGHSLVAKAYGIPVREILLLPIGGVAQLGKKPKTPAQELLIALAGPAVNVVIGGALGAALLSSYDFDALQKVVPTLQARPTLLGFWIGLAVANAMLAVFNLVPAFPMDGGRVLRALLSMVMQADRATRAAVTVGRVVAVAFMVAAMKEQQWSLGLIAVFVFFTGGLELRDAQVAGVLARVRAGDAVNPYVPRFAPGTTLGEAVTVLVQTPHGAFAVEHFGRLVGVVTREALIRAANELHQATFVAGLMDRAVPVVAPNASLEEVRALMQSAEKAYVAVCDREILLGLVTDLELAHQMELARKLRAPPAPRPEAPRKPNPLA